MQEIVSDSGANDHGAQTINGHHFGKVVVYIQGAGKANAAGKLQLVSGTKAVQGSYTLLGGEEVTLAFQLLGGLFVTVQGGGHLLVIYPLVAHELELVGTFRGLEVLVSGINELGGQFVLLLQGGIGQGSVNHVLGQVRTLLVGQRAVEVASRLRERRAYIINKRSSFVHLLEHLGELGDFSGGLVGHVHQSFELLGAGFHHHVGGYHTVLVGRIVQDELFHIRDVRCFGLPGETGSFADVAADAFAVNVPIHEGRDDEAEGAYTYHRGENDKTFLVFHDNMI